MNEIHLISLAVTFALGLVNFIRFKDVLYPPVLQAFLWFSILLLYAMFGSFFISTTYRTYLVVMNGVISFSLGAFIITYKYKAEKTYREQKKLDNGRILFEVFFWIPIIVLPFVLYKAYQTGMGGPFEEFYTNIRYIRSTTDQAEQLGPLMYVSTLTYIAIGILLLFDVPNRSTKLIVSYAIAIAYIFGSMGRSFLVMLFTITLGILGMTRRTSTVLLFFGYMTIVLIVFFTVGYLLSKGASLDATFSDNALTMKDNFITYLISPLPAFDRYISVDRVWGMGENIFRTPIAVLEAIGFDVKAVSLVQDYVFVPIPTNVYTVYQPYYADFKEIGIVVIPFILGLMHGFLYRMADKGNFFFIFIFSLSLYPLLMQHFQDQYFNLMSTWIQYTFWLCLFFFFVYRKR